MKRGESKTRTRRTLGGGTKTVTRSRGSQGSRVRKVETTKNDGEKIIKVRRKDRSGVSKHKERTVTGGNYKGRRVYAEDTHTLTEKDKFRERGSLRSKSRIPKDKYRLDKTTNRKEFYYPHGNISNTRKLTEDHKETVGKRTRDDRKNTKKSYPHYFREFTKEYQGDPNVAPYPKEKKTEFLGKKEAKREYKKRKEALKPKMAGKEREHYWVNRTDYTAHPHNSENVSYWKLSSEARKKK